MPTIYHDGFARKSLVREKRYVSSDCTCDWCGQKRKPNKNGGYHLFAYGIQEDDNSSRIAYSPKLFCCVDCFRSYGA